jgi:hypothetical protein
MKKLLLALALLPFCWGSPAPAQVGPINPILCNKTVILNIAAAGTTQLVAPVTGTTINLCGWHVTTTTTAGTFQLSFGTGATCGTGTVNITSPLSVSSTAPSADHTNYASSSGATGAGLCVTTATSATISGVFWFSTT